MDVPYKITVLLATALFLSSPGLANGSDIPVVKLTVTDENLGDVLKQISKISGYEILLNGDAGDQTISVILNDPLDEALRKVLRRFSYAAVRREEEKKVIVSIFDDSLVPNPASRNSRAADGAGSIFSSEDRDPESRNSFYTPPPPLKDILPSDYRRGSYENDLSPSVSGRGTRFVPTTPTIAD
ncbi:MAG: hypothetical protein JW896_09040 [Deltaproteobacteria bacterium]|nr:hypothetical protein [Deltaproteobacteria bacterium]